MTQQTKSSRPVAEGIVAAITDALACFSKAYVINHPMRSGREQAISAALLVAGVQNVTIWPAVMGDSMPIELMRRNEWIKSKQNGEVLNSREIGCLLSHAGVWEDIINSGIDAALVCEDRLEFLPGFADLMMRQFSSLPENWHILHFHSTYRWEDSSDEHVSRRSQVTDCLFKGYNEGGGTVCYAVSMAGAQYLRERVLPISNPSDGVTNHPSGYWSEASGQGYVAKPYPVRANQNIPSTIGGDRR